MIYLASPYSHPNSYIELERAVLAIRAAARLHYEGKLAFSPIAYGHTLAQVGLPIGTDADSWLKWNTQMFSMCTELYVLKLEGWDRSTGVAMELAWAEKSGKPISTLEADYADF